MANLPPLLIDLPRNPITAVGIPVALGLGTGFLTKNAQYGPSSFWYKSLEKPKFDPPKWAFGIVWPVLYGLMGYSSHLLVKTLDKTPPGFGRKQALRSLTLYYVQLALNQAWTPLNFAAGNLLLSLVDLTALTATLGTWLYEVKDIDERVLWLNVPYFLWSSYATYLNASLWWNNQGRAWWQSLVGKAKDKSK